MTCNTKKSLIFKLIKIKYYQLSIIVYYGLIFVNYRYLIYLCKITSSLSVLHSTLRLRVLDFDGSISQQTRHLRALLLSDHARHQTIGCSHDKRGTLPTNRTGTYHRHYPSSSTEVHRTLPAYAQRRARAQIHHLRATTGSLTSTWSAKNNISAADLSPPYS